MSGPWTCSCGRRVPGSVAACRCGQTRPERGPTLAGAADALARLPKAEAGADWSWVPKLVGVLAVVGLYFGSRVLNRHLTSREAKSAAVEALGKVLDPAQARDLVARHHDECFDPHYQTGWGRRQSASFEAEKYAKCVTNKIEKDLDRDSTALRRVVQEARARQPPATVPPAAPPPQPTPTTAITSLTLGDLKLADLKRAPRFQFKAVFVVLGSRDLPRVSCSFVVSCEGQPPGPNLVANCPLTIEGAMARGSFDYDSPTPAPAGACTLELQLSDGSRVRSNKATLGLR